MKHLRNAFLLIACLPLAVYAQSDKINTDQPDQSTGASVIHPRSFQLETSFYVNHFPGEGTAAVSSNLLRYGLFKPLEVRVVAEQGYHRDLYITESAHGSTPLAIGAKWSVLEEDETRPAVSVMAQLQLPFTNGDQLHLWSPAFTFIAEKQLNDFTLTVNAGPKQAAYERVWDFQSTADVKYEITKAVSVFGEYFGQFEAHQEPHHNIDGGLLYTPGSRLQLHISGGSSVQHHPSNYFVTTGLAYHFGK
ncbi:transporter [Chitinophaga sedimenti]|uniref:transporter n=1 Tax=Chitinophaga sedimenti TaxID=2033606 RepID=UPI002005123B|nr:transporter [Chitinophaga sedimenti]MCK7554013.1 transporter [Chitinophaga sedimenti]